MGGGASKNKSGLLKETLGDHDESVNCMCLSDDKSMLVTGSEDATARIWSAKTPETECLAVLKLVCVAWALDLFPSIFLLIDHILWRKFGTFGQ